MYLWGKGPEQKWPQLLQAAQCQAVPGFHKPLQSSRKVINAPSLWGPLPKRFLWEQLKGKPMSLPGQSLAPRGQLPAWLILGVEFHGQEEVAPSKAHSTSHSRKSLGSAQSGRAAPCEERAGSPHCPSLPVSPQSILWWGSFWPNESSMGLL